MSFVINPKLLWTSDVAEDGNLVIIKTPEEFEEKRCIVNSLDEHPPEPSANPYIWNGYTATPTSTLSTFRYLFYKFKKGVFVKIHNNKLVNFIPFSNNNFINEWANHIKIDPKYSSLNEFLESTTLHKRFNPKYVNQNISQWYANNCLVRYDNFEVNRNIVQLRHMFETLCSSRKVDDVEFFINRRDFPVLNRDRTEAYFHIFGPDQPLVSHNGEFTPILSHSITEKNADILIPTFEDWTRVMSNEDVLFPPDRKNYNYDFDVPWEQRIPVAIFRGTSTGCYVDERNPRIKAAILSTTSDLLDAGITKWNNRPRKLEDSPYLQSIDIASYPSTVPFLSPEEQATYKYILNIPGHVSAFRLSLEMSMGCCILLVDSPYTMWYSKLLVPYFHYVPVATDLSDLLEKIQWCRDHDDQCSEIADNAFKFYEDQLQKEPILDFLQFTINSINKQLGTVHYPGPKPFEYQLQHQVKQLLLHSQSTPSLIRITHGMLAYHNRLSYSTLKAIEHVFTLTQDISNIEVEKRRINVNSAYIAKYALNNLVKMIPNFSYYIGSTNSVSLYEFIGPTMNTELPNLKVKNILELLLQVTIALYVAQDWYAYIHSDLTMKTVHVQVLKSPMSIDYYIEGVHYHLLTKHIAVINSHAHHAIINGVHQGNLDMSYSYDLLSFICSISWPLLRIDANIACIILRFFDSQIVTKENAEAFLRQYKSGPCLRIPKSKSWVTKHPLNFIYYIKSTLFNYQVAFFESQTNTTSVPSVVMNKNNPQQLVNLFLGMPFLDSYIDIATRLYKSTLPQPELKIQLYYVAQQIHNALTEARFDFTQQQKSPWYVYNKLSKAIEFIEVMYSKLLTNNKHIGTLTSTTPLMTMNEYTYLNQEKPIVRFLHDPCILKVKVQSILNYQGYFKVSDQDRQAFTKMLKRQSFHDEWEQRQKIANHNTYHKLIMKNNICDYECSVVCPMLGIKLKPDFHL